MGIVLPIKHKTMKRTFTFLTVTVALVTMHVNAQAPTWSWAKTSGGSSNEEVIGAWVDASGNSYATGTFSSSSITFGSTTFNNGGGSDYFLTKYDASGNVLWAKSATGSNNDVGYGVTGDASGNLYVVGTSNSATLTFGSNTLALHGYDDIFVVKYDASGNVLWAKSAGGNANDIGQGICVDGNGNSYITGYFASPNIAFGSTTLVNGGGNDFYETAYDPSGNVLWAKNAGGSSNEEGMGIVADANGNTYVTGGFSSSSITFGSTTFNNGGGSDYFLTKYDASGNVLWAKSAIGSNNDVGYGVAKDGSGNLYVVGTFNSLSLTFGSTALTLNAYDDIFLVKYDASGNVAWAKSAGGNANDIGQGIAVGVNGNSFITGYFASPSLTIGSTTLTNSGTDNTYVAEYDASGNPLWAKSVGGTSSDRPYTIALDATGETYVGGYFSSPTVSFGSTVLTNVGGNDLFMAKLLSNGESVAEENNSGVTLSVLPNPNNGSFDLQINGIQNASHDAQLSIVDMLGQEVYHSTLNFQNTTNRIELSDLSNGMYCVMVTTGNRQYNSRVMINR